MGHERPMAATTPTALDAGCDYIDGMDFREADAHDLATLRDSNTSNAGSSRQRELDGDWLLPPLEVWTQERPRRKPKYRGLPPLPMNDFKVIVRPHQGLTEKILTSPMLAVAVIAACEGLITGEHFSLRIKPGSNIVIVSTPHQEVAEKVSRIASLMVNGRPDAVKAYVAASERATRGVIHGLQPHTPPYELKANLRPDIPVFRICGMRDPVPSHECLPKCAACGDDCLTGDLTCKKRLKPLRHTRYNSDKQTLNSPVEHTTTKMKKHLR
ncbi:hypothetical protein HPB51_007460 [Rhipicephalus microplus]|uniref:Uncharacterized protein n=1 Tax=Rhipicephalus microplus TaxID=6941 RepID=A0A9J6DZK7_RHIMP|nr:hypothetical protein HPB51_007460 [Rhipicephalus microplus]